MGWLIANAFLLVVVLIAVGYTWLAFFLLKLAHLHEYGLLVLAAFAGALVATYYTCRSLYGWIGRRI